MSEITLKKDNFKEEVLNSKGLVLVDFWATWCGPCKMLAPVLSSVAEEYADTVKVCKVNVDDEIELAREYEITSIPTLILFKDGTPIKKSVGYMPKEDILKMLM